MILDIVTIGDKRLKEKSLPVKKIDKSIVALTENMIETMYYNNGIGLAAIQVGELKRIFVIDIPNITDVPMVFINPEIVKKSRDFITYEEGCLSIPELQYKITRPRSLILHYQNEESQKKVLEADGLFAICIQHENDHLDGILFIENSLEKEHKKINKLLEKKQLPIFF